jgi:hypothetical protein
MRDMPGITVFELYLLASLLVHIISGLKNSNRKDKTLLITGCLLLLMLIKHLLDFRLSKDARESSSLFDKVFNKLQKSPIWYFLLVLTFSVHSYKGTSKAFLFKLGFSPAEIPQVLTISRVVWTMSTILYLVPLVPLVHANSGML